MPLIKKNSFRAWWEDKEWQFFSHFRCCWWMMRMCLDDAYGRAGWWKVGAFFCLFFVCFSPTLVNLNSCHFLLIGWLPLGHIKKEERLWITKSRVRIAFLFSWFLFYISWFFSLMEREREREREVRDEELFWIFYDLLYSGFTDAKVQQLCSPQHYWNICYPLELSYAPKL